MIKDTVNQGFAESSMRVVALLSFFIGMSAAVSIKWVGQLYLAEILLIPLAAIVLITGSSNKVFSNPHFYKFVIFGFLSLLGYIVSDLAVGARPDQYLRGWARVGFLVSNTIMLAIVASQNRNNIWLFVLGMATGTFIKLFLSGVPITTWKLGFGAPIGLLLLCLAFLLPKRISVLLIAVLGFTNLVFDSRVQGGLILLTAALLWSRIANPQYAIKKFGQYIKLGFLSLIAILIIIIGLAFTGDEYSDRRLMSNIGRSAGLIIGLQAIVESPIIGYGSWTENEKFSKAVSDKYKSEIGLNNRELIDAMQFDESFHTHSQIIGAAVEGGLLGAAYFIYIGFLLIKAIPWYALKRPLDKYSPLFLYLTMGGLWHLIASAFGGDTRLQIAILASILVVMYREQNLSATESINKKDDKELREAKFSILNRRKNSKIL